MATEGTSCNVFWGYSRKHVLTGAVGIPGSKHDILRRLLTPPFLVILSRCLPLHCTTCQNRFVHLGRSPCNGKTGLRSPHTRTSTSDSCPSVSDLELLCSSSLPRQYTTTRPFLRDVPSSAPPPRDEFFFCPRNSRECRFCEPRRVALPVSSSVNLHMMLVFCTRVTCPPWTKRTFGRVPLYKPPPTLLWKLRCLSPLKQASNVSISDSTQSQPSKIESPGT